jgi:hypothetical protein
MTKQVPTIDWTGQSGAAYRYHVYPTGTQFSAKPGNYCFAKEVSPGRYVPLYFGQTGNLSERFDSHHKMPCARAHGVTHIMAHLNESGEAARLREESDLVAKWKPACNG